MAKVMLVEDDNNLREIYEARMQAEGYDIVTAKDGEEALVVAKNEHPDLVISDVMMPKISGFEMLDILRNTEGLKEVKVIMLTALGQSDDQLRADKLGADRYLVKSQVTLEDIVKCAHDLLEDGATTTDEAVTTPVAAAPTTAEQAVPAAPATPVPAPVANEVPTAPQISPAVALAVEEPVAVIPEPAAVTSSDTAAQSTAQEEASVEAKIEDFVAGATTEASVPSGSSPAAPIEQVATPQSVDVEQPIEVSAVEQPTTITPTDDKVVSEAVNNLVASTSPVTSPPASQTPATAVVVPTAPQPVAAADPAAGSTDSDGNVTVANKKVISPIDNAGKPNIDQLLAAEDAKQIVEQPPTVISAQPAVPNSVVEPVSQPTTPEDPLDPNVIAL